MGNYLKLFRTEADYEAESNKPIVSHIIDPIDIKIEVPEIDTCEQYGYIDLGLPSGTLWGCKNLGANVETDYGNFYQYGKGNRTYQETSGETVYKGNENPLSLSLDAARQVLGEPWHMPTKEQCNELINNTNWTWENNFNGSGINGGKFTSKTDPTKYIFIPASGCYRYDGYVDSEIYGYIWTSTPSNISYETNSSCWLRTSAYFGNLVSTDSRIRGYTIRGVVG